MCGQQKLPACLHFFCFFFIACCLRLCVTGPPLCPLLCAQSELDVHRKVIELTQRVHGDDCLQAAHAFKGLGLALYRAEDADAASVLKRAHMLYHIYFGAHLFFALLLDDHAVHFSRRWVVGCSILTSRVVGFEQSLALAV